MPSCADRAGYINDQSLCDPQQAYVLDATTLQWSSSFVAGTQYWPPTLVANLTGADGSSAKSGSDQVYSAGDYDPFASSTQAGQGGRGTGNGVGHTYTANGSPDVATMPPSQRSSGSGLSMGATCVGAQCGWTDALSVGIIIAALVGAAALIGIALLCLRRRRNRADRYFDIDAYTAKHMRMASGASSVFTDDTTTAASSLLAGPRCASAALSPRRVRVTQLCCSIAYRRLCAFS